MTLDAFLAAWKDAFAQGGLVALGLSAVAGVLASAICPCTLPVGIGLAGISGSMEANARRGGILIASAFFAGMVVNLAVLGALAGQLGLVLSESFGRSWAVAMSILSFGAAIVAWRGPRLDVDRMAALRRPGLPGAFAYGFVFSLGTSAAPLLLLLTASAALSSSFWGFVTALAFGIGRGLPFLVAGLFSGSVIRLARLSTLRRPIQGVSAVALLLVSLYYARTFLALR